MLLLHLSFTQMFVFFWIVFEVVESDAVTGSHHQLRYVRDWTTRTPFRKMIKYDSPGRLTYFIPDNRTSLQEEFTPQIKRSSNKVKKDRLRQRHKLEQANQSPAAYTARVHEDDAAVNYISSSSRSREILTVKKRKKPRNSRRRYYKTRDDLSLWIDERQVRMFSGYTMEVYVIIDGQVNQLILDPEFENHLPIIPEEVERVNFTWFSSQKRYLYHFDLLSSHSPSILYDPTVSVPVKGRIPRKPKVFSIVVSCTGNVSGVATFSIGLAVYNKKRTPLSNTPLRLKLKKECYPKGEDPACDQQCQNGGICDFNKKCRCPDGYMGPLCATALCYPQCMNGGTCSSPGRCSCPSGFQGRHCEGGICHDKCLNGGKCIQKDVCSCTRGFYGKRCEFSKCVIPCVNGGKCKDVNKCRCNAGFSGDHCERTHSSAHLIRCRSKCRQGECLQNGVCKCDQGYSGKWCRRKGKTKERSNNGYKKSLKRKIWV